MTLLEVVKPDAGQRRAALQTLIDSLLDDPGWVHVIPNPDRRATAIRTIFWIALREADDDVRVCLIDGVVVGAATWPAPGAYPLSAKAKMRATPAMLRLVGSIRRDALPLMAFGTAIDAEFPDTAVRYLQVIGVDPAHQGQGSELR